MRYCLFVVLFFIGFTVFSQRNTVEQAPYEFTLKRELPYLLSGVGLVTIGELVKHNNRPIPLSELASIDRNEVNLFDRQATYNYNIQLDKWSDGLRLGFSTLPALLLLKKETRKDIFKLALLASEAVAINVGVTNTTKYLVQRRRPFVYNKTISYEIRTEKRARSSFFSGHTSHTATVSFFVAKVVNDYYPQMNLRLKIALWSGALVLPSTMAYLRVKSGQHYPTDVLVGLAIGGTIGWLVPHLHKRKSAVVLSAYSYKEAKGVSLYYTF